MRIVDRSSDYSSLKLDLITYSFIYSFNYPFLGGEPFQVDKHADDDNKEIRVQIKDLMKKTFQLKECLADGTFLFSHLGSTEVGNLLLTDRVTPPPIPIEQIKSDVEAFRWPSSNLRTALVWPQIGSGTAVYPSYSGGVRVWTTPIYRPADQYRVYACR